MNNPFEPIDAIDNAMPSAEDPYTKQELRDRLFAQDERLLEAATRLATVIRSIPTDKTYPNTEPRALIVGGFVRDAVLGKQPKDIDIEVYGVPPEDLESVLEQIFPGCVNTVGKSFGILKVNLGTGIEFDVSIPRRESKTGKGHTGFAVTSDPGMEIVEAARRRDFTFNALAADPLTGEVIDPFHGLEDLRRGVLRVTDPERFQDDPLRVYRALQFAARMNLTTDSESKRLMSEMVTRDDLKELAKERISEELKKMLLKAEKPSIGFELARELGIIEKYFPELDALIDVQQEPEWHPEGDVWIHTMMVVDEAAKIIRQPERGFTNEEKLEVVFGALCHDLGKPSTTKFMDGRYRSLGHEEAGEAPTRAFCDRLELPKSLIASAVAITKDHLKPNMWQRAFEQGKLDEAGYRNSLRKLLKRLHPVSWRVLIAASEADSRGRGTLGAGTNPYLPGQLFSEIVAKYQLDAEPTKPLIQGRDLLPLEVPPGARMGKIIKEIERLRDEGKITTHEEALAEAKRLVAAT